MLNPYHATLLITFPMLAIVGQAKAQNVGIGTSNVSAARLTVAGTANASSNTVGLFGTNAGISLQQNWPTIGFNQYRDMGTGFGKAISTGYGMHWAFNFNNGDWAMYRNGYSTAGNGFNQQNEIITYIESGYKLFLLTGLPNSRLEIPNKLFAAQSGKMNLVPLGIISISMTYFQNQGLQVNASNVSGSLLSGFSGSQNSNTFRLVLNLNNSLLSGYDVNKFVLIPGLNMTHVNTNNVFSIETSTFFDAGTKIQVQMSAGSASAQLIVTGNILVYGTTL